MEIMDYVGFDVHKKTISYCVKKSWGSKIEDGVLEADRAVLEDWASDRGGPWLGALESTMFSGWVYDVLQPYSQGLTAAHPASLKWISQSKKKNDRLDAERLCDLLRLDSLMASHMPTARTRDLRRALRFRKLLVRQSTAMKNKIAGVLMELGVRYDGRRLHGRGYFTALMSDLDDAPPLARTLLEMCRDLLERLNRFQKQLVETLREDPLVKDRVELLMSIPGVGQVTALTWALEIDDPHRFSAVRHAVSYCGLCSAQKESGGKSRRGPISKNRNKHLQTVLIEAAKLAPTYNPQLAAVHAREIGRGHKNRATLAVARKLTAILLAVDKRGTAYRDDLKRGAA